jgi:MraZ protein
VGEGVELWVKVERLRIRGAPLGLKGRLEHMFLGRFYHNLDEKGRITVPARYREDLGDNAFVVQGFDRNLVVYTVEGFQAFSAGVKQTKVNDANARAMRRLLFSGAEPSDVDKAGRILIPQYLREFAGLGSEVVIVGVGEQFEIWAPDEWRKQEEQLKDADLNAQRFSNLDIPSQSEV